MAAGSIPQLERLVGEPLVTFFIVEAIWPFRQGPWPSENLLPETRTDAHDVDSARFGLRFSRT